MYVLERRALLTWSRYCGISSASRLEMATESSEGFMMHALPGSRERRRGRSPHSTSMAWIKGKGKRKKSPQHINAQAALDIHTHYKYYSPPQTQLT